MNSPMKNSGGQKKSIATSTIHPAVDTSDWTDGGKRV
jgi:hypothetical protein